MDFIGRGRMVTHPAELIMTDNFAELIRACSTLYDVVIVDTPPILSVTDAAIIGRYASTSLMVVRFEQNSIKEVEAGLRRFEQNDVAIQGTIFNGVEKGLLSLTPMVIILIRISALFLIKDESLRQQEVYYS